MNKNSEDNISLFFKNPNDFEGSIGVHSTLYLLRRDASLCLGYDPNNNQKIQFEALFPGTMAILAGIDLVAKFVYRDLPNKVGERYRDYVSEYIGKRLHDEGLYDKRLYDKMYQLRNSLLHSYGLYSETSNGKVYHFVLTRGLGKLFEQVSDKSHLVDIEILWKQFEMSLESYHKELLASSDLQQIFSEMFPKYGLIGIK